MAKQVKKTQQNKPSQKPQEEKVSLLGAEFDVRVLWLLAVVTLFVYIRAAFGELTNWDDQVYVTNNKLITGLNWAKLKEIFTEGQVGNYHPFTMLSYAIEYRLFGLSAKAFHITNIVFHIASTLFVYRLSRLLKFGVEASFIVAMLFALHPMHVESVAWVSERKDVLYTFFYTASLVCYVKYAVAEENRDWRYYSLSIGLFLCALLSKGQAVSFSLIILAIDYYLARGWSKQVLFEKIPFLALSLLFGIVAIKVQQSFGYMGALQIYSLTDRLYFASYGLVLYIFKFFLPFKLACFIPFPAKKDLLIYASPFILILLAYLAYRSSKTSRVILFGVMFFLGSIAMVLQILPVGGALLSERYSYVPYIGFSFIAGFWAEQVLIKYHKQRKPLTVIFSIILLSLALASFNRIAVWHDSLALWTDAIAKYPSAVAYNNRGSVYKAEKKRNEAIADYTASLRFIPTYYEALVARGEMLREIGRVEEAFQDLDKAIRTRPNPDWSAFMNRAVVYCMKGQLDKAKTDFDSASSKPNDAPELFGNLGNYWDMTGNYEKAIECYNKAISINPKFENAYISRATANCRKKKYDLAMKDFEVALKLRPDFPEVYLNRSYVYNDLQKYSEALQDATKAQELGATVDVNYMNLLKQKANNSK